MSQQYKCLTCQIVIPEERVQFLLETERKPDFCVAHSTEEAVIAFASGDKGMTYVVVVDPKDEEKLQTAKLANKFHADFS